MMRNESKEEAQDKADQMLNSISSLVQAQRETLESLMGEKQRIENAFRMKQDEKRGEKEMHMDNLAKTQDERLEVEKIRFE